jgi:hypothetical protein
VTVYVTIDPYNTDIPPIDDLVMSWRGRGSLADGPPLASGGTGKRLVDRYRPHADGIGAFERETRGAQWYHRGPGSGAWEGERRSEWDVLKENHR